MTQNDTLTQKQRKFMQCLLQEDSVTGAAICAGISTRTAYRYLEGSHFRASLAAIEATTIEQMARSLLRLSEKAVEVLESLLTAEKDSDKLRACGLILDKLLTVRELSSLEVRLSELERMVQDEGNTQNTY